MIGQSKNIETLIKWRVNKSIPRFILIEGEEGSGRLTLAKTIIKMLSANGVIVGNGIDDVRTVIQDAYTVQSTTVYIFRDADDMSTNAKNALLKVVEEPPNRAYFIMTLRSIEGTLNTIRSRGTVIKMEPYTNNQLLEFVEDATIAKYATTPGQAKELTLDKVKEVEACVQGIIQALYDKSGTNLLKESTKLQAKTTESDKIQCKLFLTVFERNFPVDLFNLTVLESIEICKQEMRKSSINKKASIECMLLRILEDLKNAEIS